VKKFIEGIGSVIVATPRRQFYYPQYRLPADFRPFGLIFDYGGYGATQGQVRFGWHLVSGAARNYHYGPFADETEAGLVASQLNHIRLNPDRQPYGGLLFNGGTRGMLLYVD
jgi:hypothetical protein